MANEEKAGRNGAADAGLLPPGFSLADRYTIIKHLAAGGFGITYLAEHSGLGKRFAIKEHFPREFAFREGTSVRPNTADKDIFGWALQRFAEEARKLAKFEHPAIVDVVDVFGTPDRQRPGPSQTPSAPQIPAPPPPPQQVNTTPSPTQTAPRSPASRQFDLHADTWLRSGVFLPSIAQLQSVTREACELRCADDVRCLTFEHFTSNSCILYSSAARADQFETDGARGATVGIRRITAQPQALFRVRSNTWIVPGSNLPRINQQTDSTAAACSQGCEADLRCQAFELSASGLCRWYSVAPRADQLLSQPGATDKYTVGIRIIATQSVPAAPPAPTNCTALPSADACRARPGCGWTGTACVAAQ